MKDIYLHVCSVFYRDNETENQKELKRLCPLKKSGLLEKNNLSHQPARPTVLYWTRETREFPDEPRFVIQEGHTAVVVHLLPQS